MYSKCMQVAECIYRTLPALICLGRKLGARVAIKRKREDRMNTRSIAACAALFLALTGQPIAAQELEKVTLSFSFRPSGDVSNLVALADQFAKNEGLQVELMVPASGSDAVKLLAS